MFSRLSSIWFICICFSSLLFFNSCDQSVNKREELDEKRTESYRVTPGGIYKVPLLNNPATLDPAYVQDEYGTAVVQQLFDGLVQFDPYLMILPALAKTWQVDENGTSYRFVIHEKARFHNGSAVTAEDVVFSLSRLLRIEPSPVILPQLLKIKGAKAYKERQSDVVKGLKVVDPRVVLIQLDEPYTPFLTALGMYQAKIVPKAEVMRLGDSFGVNPVGSGPFKFGSWETDTVIKLERFSDYYRGAAFLEGVEYRVYRGVKAGDILTDFRNEKLDEMMLIGDARKELLEQEDLQWFHRPSLSLMFYGIRGDKPPLDNPEFRKKLSLAIDREKLIARVYDNYLEPAEHILPPGMPGFSKQDNVEESTSKKVQKNLDNTREQRMEETLAIEIVSSSQSTFAQAEFEYIRDAWAGLGVNLEIKYITDWPEFERYINSDSVQIYRYAWFADMPDPDSFLYPLFASNSPANFMRFNNQAVDQLLLSARGEEDPAQRIKMYADIERLIMASAPVIPLLYPSVDRVYRPHVKDAQPSALGADYMSLHRVWLQQEELVR